MKKVVSMFLVLLLSLNLCACGFTSTDPTPATIKDLSGNTVQLTKKELVSIYKENAAKFRNSYSGAEITGVATVSKVKESYENFWGSLALVYTISTEEGWVLELLASKHEEVINLSKGDKIQFNSKISGVSGNTVMLNRIGGSGSLLNAPNEDSTVIKVLE